MSAETAVHVHYAAALVWVILALGTTAWAIYDAESHYLLAWVIFMSAYANIASHLSAAAGAGPSQPADPSEESS